MSKILYMFSKFVYQQSEKLIRYSFKYRQNTTMLISSEFYRINYENEVVYTTV